MKALPYLTLAICVGLLVVQQVVISSGSKSNTKLKTRISEVKASRGAERAGGRGPRATLGAQLSRKGDRDAGSAYALPKSLADMELEAFAKAMKEAERAGSPNLEAMMRVQTLLLEATPEELAELVARTSELDAPDEFKRGFIIWIIGEYAEKDPRAALELAFSIESVSAQRERKNFAGAFRRLGKRLDGRRPVMDKTIARRPFSLPNKLSVPCEFTLRIHRLPPHWPLSPGLKS